MPAAFARALRECEEGLRPADLLGEERDRARAFVVEHEREMIFDPEHGFVAGRHLIGHGDAARCESARDVEHRCAALRDDGGGDAAALGGRRDGAERVGDAVDEVREAQAVGAVDGHAAARGDVDDRLLVAASGVVLFGEARREHHRSADAERRQRCERFHNAGPRHAQHRRIDAGRQIFDAADAAPAVDRIAVTADQMQFAREPETLEVADLRFAE